MPRRAEPRRFAVTSPARCLLPYSEVYRHLLVCAALCCLPACLPPPGTPSPLHTDLTGEWSGTLESSWGTLPVKFTLSTPRNTTSITGTFALNGQRATGTVGGVMETRVKDDPAMFYGSLTISYVTPADEQCHSTSGVAIGAAFPTSMSIVTDGFSSGTCPDPPASIRIALHR
jgi:hypothetical protein